MRPDYFRINYLFIIYLLAHVSGAPSNQKTNIRIIGGHPVEIEQYPYQVSLLYRGSHSCGGSLIKSDYVLTAAHCTYGNTADDFSVRAGSSIINEGGIVNSVSEIYQHPYYNDDTYQNDVAVLKLSQPFPLISGIQVIDMAEKQEELPTSTMGAVTGWGRIGEYGPVPQQLQEVDIPTVADDYCRSIYDNKGHIVDDGMLCAGYKEGGKDTCQGDSGGPFAFNGKIYGITSFGDVCGMPNSPGVYAKISYFRDYIDKIVQ